MGYIADYLIVGGGFAGAVFARCAADAGYTCLLIDKRNHIGGNAYSYKDEATGIEVHKYGPHIFHTNSKEIWDFVSRFTSFLNYTHRVKAAYNGCVYSLPVNLHTINQFFRKDYTPAEAEAFITSISIKGLEINNFENFVLSSLGEELYKAFFRDYTIKQWGKAPSEITTSTAKRLPIRYNYDDNYYYDIYQGIPSEGYTKIFERLVNHSNISVALESGYDEYKQNWRSKFKKLVFTGSLDDYFNYEFGALPYRTVTFEEIRGKDIIGTAQMNYTDMKEKFTRICEHKWFTPNIEFNGSVAYKEFADFSDSKKNPYYPIRDDDSEAVFSKYEALAGSETDVIFIGRLAEFRYYDMHQVIASSISKFKNCVKP